MLRRRELDRFLGVCLRQLGRGSEFCTGDAPSFDLYRDRSWG